MEVNSNGIITGEVNHCYAFGKVNEVVVFSDDDFPCPTFSNNYGSISHDDDLPFLGGGGDTGTVRIKRFEWLEWLEWTDWGPCTLTCGSGIRTRTRTQPTLGKNETDIVACNTDPCCKFLIEFDF